MPTFGSLFAGIGGIDLGLERAGWTGRWQVEWDGWCRERLTDRWPDVPKYGDISDVEWGSTGAVDLLAGGFPCQPVSAAGRQKAQADARWLWPEFHRAIRALRPSLVLVENVPNLLAVNGGSAFGDVLGDLAASGYDTEWDCIPAAAVGAPHERDRVFLVAYPDGSGLGSDEQHDAARQSDPRRGSSTVADSRRGSVRTDGGRGQAHGSSGPAEGQEDQRQRGGHPAGGGGAAMADAPRDGRRAWRQGDTTQGSEWREPDRGRLSGSVADTDGVGREGEWVSGISGDGDPSRRDYVDGRRGPLAYADSPRLEGRVFHPERGSEWFAGPGGLADAIGGGWDGRTPDTRRHQVERTLAGRTGTARGRGQLGVTQSRLGRTADGFPHGLDHCWPAPPGPQFDWEPPRTVAGRVPERVQRLKACGNAVVPQVVHLIGAWLMDAYRSERAA